MDELEFGDRLLCSRCVDDQFLNNEIKNRGREGTCSYCGEVGRTFTIEDLADEVESALEDHYRITPPEAPWEREGDPIEEVIMWMAKIDEAPAKDIREFLADGSVDRERDRIGEENPFDEEAHYVETENK